MKTYRYKSKPITRARCSRCKKRIATSFYKTKPVCTECFYILTRHRGYVRKGKPSNWLNKLIEKQKNV